MERVTICFNTGYNLAMAGSAEMHWMAAVQEYLKDKLLGYLQKLAPSKYS